MPPNENLSALIRQAVIFQEILRSNPEENGLVANMTDDKEPPGRSTPIRSRTQDKSPIVCSSAAVSEKGRRGQRQSTAESASQAGDFDLDDNNENGANNSSGAQENSTSQLVYAQPQGALLCAVPSPSKKSIGNDSKAAEDTEGL
jgi:hypothetical protein